jgi:hypothetical protein
MSVLEDRYQGNIKALNKIYGTSFKSFQDLKANGTLEYPNWVTMHKTGAPMPKAAGSQNIYDDSAALLGEIVEQVHFLGHSEIRKVDKNHMILGSYVKEATYTEEIWHRIAPYIDVLAPQHVSKVFPISPMVEALGKPAIISDQPYGNVYSDHLLTQRAAFGPVPDHVDRHLLYDLLAERISVDPDLAGVNMCACLFTNLIGKKPMNEASPGFGPSMVNRDPTS